MGQVLSSLGEGMKNQHGVLTWVAVQGLRMLTAAAGEASRADTRVTAALGIMALASILQSSPRHQAKETTAFPLPLPRWASQGSQGVVSEEVPGRVGPGK